MTKASFEVYTGSFLCRNPGKHFLHDKVYSQFFSLTWTPPWTARAPTPHHTVGSGFIIILQRAEGQEHSWPTLGLGVHFKWGFPVAKAQNRLLSTLKGPGNHINWFRWSTFFFVGRRKSQRKSSKVSKTDENNSQLLKLKPLGLKILSCHQNLW